MEPKPSGQGCEAQESKKPMAANKPTEERMQELEDQMKALLYYVGKITGTRPRFRYLYRGQFIVDDDNGI